MASWGLSKEGEDYILLINNKPAFNLDRNAPFGPIKSVDTGRTAEELWINFIQWKEGKRLPRRLFNKGQTFTQIDVSSNSAFLKDLQEQTNIGRRLTKTQKTQKRKIVEVEEVEIESPEATEAEEKFVQCQEMKAGQFMLNIDSLTFPPEDFRCREINTEWKTEIRESLKVMPVGQLTVLPVLVNPTEVDDNFDINHIEDYSFYILGGNHFVLAAKELITDEPDNTMFNQYRNLRTDVYCGLTPTQAVYIGNIHNKATATLKLTFQDKVIQARKLYLKFLENPQQYANQNGGSWKDTAITVFGRIEKVKRSKDSLSTIWSVTSYSERNYSEFIRLVELFKQIDQPLFKALQGLAEVKINQYLKRIDNKAQMKHITTEIILKKKTEKLHSFFIQSLGCADTEQAESRYPEHYGKLEYFTGLSFPKGGVPAAVHQLVNEARNSVAPTIGGMDVKITISKNSVDLTNSQKYLKIVEKYEKKLLAEISKISDEE